MRAARARALPVMPEFVTMFCDDDELPRAAAAAAKPQASPLWPPADNNDMSTWPQGSPWPASKTLSAEQKVKEMEEEYKVLGEDQLRGKMITFRGVLKQPSDSLMPNKSPFTYRENAWIQLEALRRVWVKRQESAAKWGEVCLRRPASQHAGQVADTQLPSLCCRRLTNCRHRRETEVVAAPERARCDTVPKAATRACCVPCLKLQARALLALAAGLPRHQSACGAWGPHSGPKTTIAWSEPGGCRSGETRRQRGAEPGDDKQRRPGADAVRGAKCRAGEAAAAAGSQHPGGHQSPFWYVSRSSERTSPSADACLTRPDNGLCAEPKREGKSGGGGRPDGGEFDGFRHTPGRNPAGNQQNPAHKSGGAGRTRSKKPPPECAPLPSRHAHVLCLPLPPSGTRRLRPPFRLQV